MAHTVADSVAGAFGRAGLQIWDLRFQSRLRSSASLWRGLPGGSRRSSSFWNASARLRRFSCWRVCSVRKRWPLISEFCSDSAQARNWREQDSARAMSRTSSDFRFEIADCRSAPPVCPGGKPCANCLCPPRPGRAQLALRRPGSPAGDRAGVGAGGAWSGLRRASHGRCR